MAASVRAKQDGAAAIVALTSLVDAQTAVAMAPPMTRTVVTVALAFAMKVGAEAAQ